MSKPFVSVELFYSGMSLLLVRGAGIRPMRDDITTDNTPLEIYTKSVINMGTKVYNKLPSYVNSYNFLKKEWKSFLLLHTFYSVEEFVSL
jgi:hypothetical protein